MGTEKNLVLQSRQFFGINEKETSFLALQKLPSAKYQLKSDVGMFLIIIFYSMTNRLQDSKEFPDFNDPMNPQNQQLKSHNSLIYQLFFDQQKSNILDLNQLSIPLFEEQKYSEELIGPLGRFDGEENQFQFKKKFSSQKLQETRHSNDSQLFPDDLDDKKPKKKRKWKTNNEDQSQWEDIAEDVEFYLEDKFPYQKRKKKKSRIGKKSSTKNLLINIRSLFTSYLKENCLQAYSHQFIQKFDGKSVNREDYQQLFRMPEYEQLLKKMFDDRYLNRQLQVTRVDHKLKSVYIKKLKVMEKAFKKKRFPRLN